MHIFQPLAGGFRAPWGELPSIRSFPVMQGDDPIIGRVFGARGMSSFAHAYLSIANIKSGTIDGAIIGASSAAAGTFTDLTATGNCVQGDTSADTVTMNAGSWDAPSAGTRINFRLGDATRTDRTMFRSRGTNEGSNVGVIPNGTSNVAAWTAFSSSDPDNSHFIGVLTTATTTAINSSAIGTGTQRSLSFQIGGTTKATLDTVGNWGVGTSSFGTSAVSVIGVATGTAPTTGPADTVQFYSSDDAAGHTIPSFYCEGTNVIATGQADSASSVRVKVRINGTVVTLLAI
jgi:hypothetical protein